jgi:hypothetical protein
MGIDGCSVQMIAGLIHQQQVARNQSKSRQGHSGLLTKFPRTPLMAICSHKSRNMGSSMSHAARLCLMFDDAFTCFSNAGSIDLILIWCAVQYPGDHISLSCQCNYSLFSLS